ncbi:serine hydrolase [Candidatus Poribacteria bacterium]|nr:serine hydrolase [Candidatus Poribacteria bacterium]MYG08874.1 serine hydrolase [Candidatus Poribacteria bacterium]MYK21862.1 serine hydrolase [Candidatus Poribacteria bacterium]
MFRHIQKLVILLISWSIVLLFPIFTASAATSGNTSSKYDSTIDSPLEDDFDRYIKSQRRRKILAGTDRTSFVVYDISQNKKIVSINEDRQMMAASIIKNFVMLAYFHEVKYGRQKHTAVNKGNLRAMIRYSSNPSTNYFIRLLGGPAQVNRILKANYRYFKQTRIVEYIPASGRTYKNMTSARDLSTFFLRLWQGKLPHSEKMKWYFKLKNGDYIYKQTYIPASVEVYNKTGTVYGLVGDGGVLVLRDPQGRARPYIFIGLMEDRTKTNRGNRWQSFYDWKNRRAYILRRLSEQAYKYIYEKHYGGRLVRR